MAASIRRAGALGGRGHVEPDLFIAPHQREGNTQADLLRGQQAVQIIDARDGLVGEADDDILFPEAGGRRRTVPLNRRHEHTAFCRQMVQANHASRQ